ncbi:MAG: EamA family transporter [Patescibacteria group bacterium]|jgi:transporter family protein
MTSSWLWLPLALLSAFFAALIAIFGKIGLSRVDTTTATMLRAMIMFLVLLAVVLFSGKLSSVNAFTGKQFFWIVLAGIAGALSWLFYFWALKVGKASQVAPVDRLSAIFVVIFAALFLSEAVGWKTVVGSALMVLGAIFVALG